MITGQELQRRQGQAERGGSRRSPPPDDTAVINQFKNAIAMSSADAQHARRRQGQVRQGLQCRQVQGRDRRRANF